MLGFRIHWCLSHLSLSRKCPCVPCPKLCENDRHGTGTCPGQVPSPWCSPEGTGQGQDMSWTWEDMHTFWWLRPYNLLQLTHKPWLYSQVLKQVSIKNFERTLFYFVTQILLDKKMVGGQVPLMTQKQGHDKDMGLNRPVADHVPEKVLSMPKSRE